jgi:hypothetical protein
MSLEQQARYGRGDAQEKLAKLFDKLPQLRELIAQIREGRRRPEYRDPDTLVTERPFPTQREIAFRSARETAEALPYAPPSPSDAPADDPPPKPPWYENGTSPGLSMANRLKRLLGPKPEPGDGGWMWKR